MTSLKLIRFEGRPVRTFSESGNLKTNNYLLELSIAVIIISFERIHRGYYFTPFNFMAVSPKHTRAILKVFIKRKLSVFLANVFLDGYFVTN